MTMYKSHMSAACDCPENACKCQSTWVDPNNIGEIKWARGIDCNGCEVYQDPSTFSIPFDLCAVAPPVEEVGTVLGIGEDSCVKQETGLSFVQRYETPPIINDGGGATATQNENNPHEWTLGIDWCAVSIPVGVIDMIVGAGAGGCILQESASSVIGRNVVPPTYTGEDGIVVDGTTISINWCQMGISIPAGNVEKLLGTDSGNCVVVGDGKFIVCDAISCMPLGNPTDAGAREYVGADCKRYPLPDDVCTTLASAPNGGVGVFGTTEFIGPDCQRYTLPVPPTPTGTGPIIVNPETGEVSIDICAALADVPDNGTVASFGSTKFVGPDCQVYTLPVPPTPTGDGPINVDPETGEVSIDICAALATITISGGVATPTTQLVGADCQLYTLPEVVDPGCPISLTTDTALGCDPTLDEGSCTLNIPCIAVGRNFNENNSTAVVIPENTVTNVPFDITTIDTVPSFAQPVPGDEDEGCVRVPCDGLYDVNMRMRVRQPFGTPAQLTENAFIGVFVTRNSTTGIGGFSRQYINVPTQLTFDLVVDFSRQVCLNAGDYLCMQVYFEDPGNAEPQTLEATLSGITMIRSCSCS